MQQKIRVRNHSDAEGRPAGGTVEGVGIAIVWQDGPLGEQPASSAPVFRMGAQQAFPPDVPGHNGAFVEGVLAAAQARLEFYQASPFKCSVRPQDNFLFTPLADPDHNHFNFLVSSVGVVEIGALIFAIVSAQRPACDDHTSDAVVDPFRMGHGLRDSHAFAEQRVVAAFAQVALRATSLPLAALHERSTRATAHHGGSPLDAAPAGLRPALGRGARRGILLSTSLVGQGFRSPRCRPRVRAGRRRKAGAGSPCPA